MKALVWTFIFSSSMAFAAPNLINGRPVGDLFPAVGTFNFGCTITKVGPTHFLTAAHCLSGDETWLSLSFKNYYGTIPIASAHIHPSWLEDCSHRGCDGTEVGGPNMTPGRADVALVRVKIPTPKIPTASINFGELKMGQKVAMVGAGCTRDIEPGGRAQMRFALTRLVSSEALEHERSLYKEISETTGMANWITPGRAVSDEHASLCPGDSGGPLMARNESGDWEVVGVAADYTFDGPYADGELTVTNLHARVDDYSFGQVGQWLRQVWDR